MQERIVSLTSDLVAIPSHETEELAQKVLAAVLVHAGFDVTMTDVVAGRPNLVARRGHGGVLLNTHIDTHPPHDHPDPFTCRQQGAHLVGRGVVDTKGQIGALVAAVEAVPDAPVTIVITCDEETGGTGSEQVQVPDGPWFRDGAIVLEPTGFRICTAQAGNLDVRVDVSAPSSHAYATTDTGSPINAVLSVVEELDTLPFLKRSHPLLGRPRTNVGHIAGGEHPWRTPSRATVALTLGLVPGTDPAEATADVRTRLDDLARRWGGRGTSFLYEVYDASDPVEHDPADVPIAARIAEAMNDEPLVPAGFPSWTDGGHLFTKHGLRCVVFGAGELAPAHSNHEWVAVADLVRLAEILTRVLSSA